MKKLKRETEIPLDNSGRVVSRRLSKERNRYISLHKEFSNIVKENG